MQRFGAEIPVNQIQSHQDPEQFEQCQHDPETCTLESYLADLSKPPSIPNKNIPEKLTTPSSSPGKENVPPKEEWMVRNLENVQDLPSPLKSEAPTWVTKRTEEKLCEDSLLESVTLNLPATETETLSKDNQVH